MIQTVIRSDPYAVFLRINLTGTIPAAAAGAVARMLGAPGFWTQEAGMLDAAISATLAGQEGNFNGVFQTVF